MDIVATKHFLSQWEERVGKYYPRVKKKIYRAIRRGEHRMQRNQKLGILVPVEFRGEKVYVIGKPDEENFVLITVLTLSQANAIGWRR